MLLAIHHVTLSGIRLGSSSHMLEALRCVNISMWVTRSLLHLFFTLFSGEAEENKDSILSDITLGGRSGLWEECSLVNVQCY